MTIERLFGKLIYMQDIRLNKVKKFYKDNGFVPSYSQMMKLFDLSSKDSVFHQVKKWINTGVFEKVNKTLVPTDQFFVISILGDIKAGHPNDVYTQNNTISLREFIPDDPQRNFLLKVSGDSMIEAGINDGDFVFLDNQKIPRNGDVVAANIDEQWTLKYFFKENQKVILRPANKNYQDFIPAKKLEIAGVVIKVIRKYY